jgi:hypothetical protein
MKFKKLLIASTVLFTANAFSGETITWTMPFPPGGGSDQVLQQLRPLLEAKGHKVEVKYKKSCPQSLDILNQNIPNTVLNISNGLYEPSDPDALCKINNNTPDIVLFKSTNINPFYFCTSPNKQMGLIGLSTGNKRIGIVSEKNLVKYTYDVVKNLKKENDIKVVPYRGGGEVTRAAKAGDVDAWIGASQINVFPPNEIVCFGSSIKNDPRGMPFIGNITKKGTEFPEFQVVNLLWSKKGAISPEVSASFDAALNSAEFKEYLKKTFKVLPTADSDEMLKKLIEADNYFNSLPEVK